jgi:hypothetical protein
MNKRICKKRLKREISLAQRLDTVFTALGKVFTRHIHDTLETPSFAARLFCTEQERLDEFNRTHDWVRFRF